MTPLIPAATTVAAFLALEPAALAGGPSSATELQLATSSIRIDDEAPAAQVRKAVMGAGRRLANPRCAQVLSEFTDAENRKLQTNLDAAGLSASGYLARLEFHDGGDRRPCATSGVAAFTTPGSLAVWICTRQFAIAHYTYPDLAEFLIIHEALHSLGLGENPPSSEQITRRVAARCGR